MSAADQATDGGHAARSGTLRTGVVDNGTDRRITTTQRVLGPAPPHRAQQLQSPPLETNVETTLPNADHVQR